jgi:ParB family transcriptional regulator, chromosome partitioning protein
MKDTRAIADIKIGERHRRDMDDLATLAASIEAVGLLHPPVVDKNNVLVAGERRIRAALLLGWTDIQVTVIDIAEIVLGEYAENEVRKDFTLSEAVAIKRTIEPAFVAEAEPDKFGHLAEEMDRTGKVDGAFKQLKASPADVAKADRAEATSAAAKAKPGGDPALGQLVNAVDQVMRIDIDVAARMSDDDRVEVLAQVARADARLGQIATATATHGGANLGALAPPSRLQPALKFLKEAVTRIEAAMAAPRGHAA